MEIVGLIAYCVCTTIRLLVSFMETALVVRAVLSWLPMDQDALVPRLLFALTEPVIMPVRMLLSRFGIGGEDSPIDFSPMITMILLMIIGVFLPVITL